MQNVAVAEEPGQRLPHQVKCKMEATEVTASKDKAVVEKQSRYEAEEASGNNPKKARKKAAQKAQNLAAKSSEVEKELEQKCWGSC